MLPTALQLEAASRRPSFRVSGCGRLRGQRTGGLCSWSRRRFTRVGRSQRNLEGNKAIDSLSGLPPPSVFLDRIVSLMTDLIDCVSARFHSSSTTLYFRMNKRDFHWVVTTHRCSKHLINNPIFSTKHEINSYSISAKHRNIGQLSGTP